MPVRAKMVCQYTSRPYRPLSDELISTQEIRLSAVWAGSTEAQQASENAIFGKYSPSGSLNISIANPRAARYFVPGIEYYIDITACTPVTEEILDPLRKRVTESEERLAQSKLAVEQSSQDSWDYPGLVARIGEAEKMLADARFHLEQAMALFLEQQEG